MIRVFVVKNRSTYFVFAVKQNVILDSRRFSATSMVVDTRAVSHGVMLSNLPMFRSMQFALIVTSYAKWWSLRGRGVKG